MFYHHHFTILYISCDISGDTTSILLLPNIPCDISWEFTTPINFPLISHVISPLSNKSSTYHVISPLSYYPLCHMWYLRGYPYHPYLNIPWDITTILPSSISHVISQGISPLSYYILISHGISHGISPPSYYALISQYNIWVISHEISPI